jgi:diguanylate cyclase (GGDEF)-like protein
LAASNVAIEASSESGHVEAAAENSQPAEATSIESPPAAPPAPDDIPAEWHELLDKELGTNSFVEASIQVLRLEVGKYRELLVSIDQRVRQMVTTPDLEALQHCLLDLREANRQWLQKQNEATNHLQARKGKLGDYAQLGNQLEEVLLAQAAQIETSCTNIELLDLAADVAAGSRRMISETAKLLDQCHALRDAMHESMVAILSQERRLSTIDRKLQIDALTGLCNRSGFERALQQWWFDDPSRKRLASIGLIDLDRLGRCNEGHGPIVGDHLLRATARLLTNLLRQNRGHDLAFRFAGQQFIAFLGDTGPHSATSCLERIRQTIQSSKFLLHESELPVTVTCGVTEILADDSSRTLLERAQKTLRAAKKAGRNQTYLHDGTEPQPVKPPEYQVLPRTVRLDFDDDV